MAGQTLAFSCRCGQTHGKLHDITPKSGTQLQCHCDDCRRAVIWLGEDDPGPDGVRYFQTTPARFEIEAAKLKAFKWTDGKLLRWYAPCCNTPLFNTLDSPKWAFASIAVNCVTDPTALGAVAAHSFVPRANGKMGHDNMGAFMWGFAKRVVGARLSGSWRKTPFFDTAGTPVAAVQTLTEEDRAKAPL